MDNAFSINRLSAMFEHDRRRVTRALERVQPVGAEGRAKLYTVRQYLDAFMAGAEDDDGKPLDLTRERALLARAQRRLTEQNISEREAAAEVQDWQSETIKAIALFVRLRLRPMGAWTFEALSRRQVALQPRAVAAQIEEWALGIGHELESALLEAATEARRRNLRVTEWAQMLDLSDLPETATEDRTNE